MWYSRSSGLDWRPKNLRNFLRDFHFSFMSYCWRSWATYLPLRVVCVCVWHHPQRGACSGDFWTHTSQVSEKWKLCLLCLCLSCCFCLFSFFGDPISSGLSVYLLLYSHSGRRRLRRRCCRCNCSCWHNKKPQPIVNNWARLAAETATATATES